jgi:hypothetical protein
LSERPRFHLAFPVTDLADARRFYHEVLGCGVGRSAERWVDFDLYGHQLSAHLVDTLDEVASNGVDGDSVPTRHFGLILPPKDWSELRQRIVQHEVPFLIAPKSRDDETLQGQQTFFICDPAGNALEFKSFADDALIFKT